MSRSVISLQSRRLAFHPVFASRLCLASFSLISSGQRCISHSNSRGQKAGEGIEMRDDERRSSQPDPIPIENDQREADLHAPDYEYQTLDCRSFWQAGSHDAFPTPSHIMHEALEHSDFECARVHPKFLHSNATSHKWAFGAIAELLDNAVDEICNGATFVKVDRVFNSKDSSPVLLFQDDGGGMDPGGIRKCMSLGFSSKKTSKTIGQYGNGFKTSTMRLGADAIVFSCSERGSHPTQSIGLLSYTFLTRTMKNDIIVPMIDFEIVEDQAVPLVYGSQNDWNSSLRIILDWSPFSSKEELLMQFKDIGRHGTKVLVYNLWYDDDGLLELDFDDDDEDIRLRDCAKGGGPSSVRNEIIQSHISYTYRYSLRAYASILYLRKFTKFSIILRGKPVQQLSISSELKFSKIVRYRPYVGKEDSVKATIGFTKEAPLLGMYGFNIYHKNRLIMPFWKVFHEGSNRGKCVVGILEANFIEPAHDKQDFERSPLFNRLETRLKQIILEYWKTHCYLVGYQTPQTATRENQKKSSKASSVPAPNMQELAAGQPVVGPSSTSQYRFPENNPIIGFSANHQKEMPNVQPVMALASNVPVAQPVIVLEDGSCEGNEDIDILDSTSIEKMSEENIQLFMKREEYRCREIELNQMIQKLEDELEEARRKCTKLSSDIEIRKKKQVAGR